MRLPLIPTALVAGAVALMIGLGIWQLQRAEQKQKLLARYEQAAHLPPVAWPAVPPSGDALYFRKAAGFCLEVSSWRAVAGRNLKDEAGWSHIASCRTGAEGPGMQVDIGWSKSSDPPSWRGGEVQGIIVPDKKHTIRLIAARPAPGLMPSAPPTRESIPNNHMLYVFTWFFFAAAALVIYLIALRQRRITEGSDLPEAKAE